MKKISIRRDNLLDDIIWLLTVALFASFYILDMSTAGSMVQFALSVLVLLLSALTHKGKIRLKLQAFHGFVFLFIVFCFLSSIWALNRSLAIQKGFTILQILVSMSLLYIHYDRKTSVDSLVKVIMWSGYVVSIYAIFFYFGLGRTARIILSAGRIGNEFSNANSLGMLAAYAIIFSSFYAIYYRPQMSHLLTIPCIVMVAISGSRKALVAMVVGILFLLLQKYATRNLFKSLLKITLFAVLAFFVLRALSTMQLFEGVNQRMEGLINLITGEGKADSSALTRQRFIEAGIEQFRQTPLLGVGMGNSRFVAASYGERLTYLHNNYVELLASGGIVGFICYYAMYTYIGIKLLRYRKLPDPFTALMITFLALVLILDYGAVSYYSKSTYFYLMVFFLHIRNLERMRASTARNAAPVLQVTPSQ